jgi:RHS repeat-associated protein
LATGRRPDIFNTDQGSQFTPEAFTGLLTQYGAAISMDGDGNRISKTQGGVKTKYINDVALGLVQVLMETDDAGDTVTTYTYGNDLIAMNREDADFYYHYDALGSVRQLTDDSGAVIASYTYDSFGNVIASTGTVTNTYGFTGGQQLGEADDLVFLRARYHDPRVGRFISRDPILTPMQIGSCVGWLLPYLNLLQTPQALSPYIYVKNNPVNLADPLGLLDPIFLPGIYPTPAVPPTVPSVCKGAWAPQPRTTCKMACGAVFTTVAWYCGTLPSPRACLLAAGAAAAGCMEVCDLIPIFE